MKGLFICDPLSKFTIEAVKKYEYKLTELGIDVDYVEDYNHAKMANPKEYNLKMEKEGPEWITPEPEVLEKLKDADILMTSFCGVSDAMLEAAKKLKLVYMMRSGFENCNVELARKRGITVCNAAEYCVAIGRYLKANGSRTTYITILQTLPCAI